MNTIEWLDSLAQDVRYAWRGMRSAPVFTVVAVLTLALGIGVNATVFTVTNAVLFKGFQSVRENDRILYVDTQRNGRGCCVSFPDFEEWRAQTATFEGMGAVADLQIVLNDESDRPERYDATRISAAAFKLVGQTPILGRDFASSDEAPGAAAVAILRYDLWERRYGKDPAIIGRTIRINGAPTTVVGVMPERFSFPQNQDLWVPLTPTPDLLARQAPLWFAFGRLKPGVTLESARAEMEVIGRRLASEHPQTNHDVRPRVQNFTEFFIGANATAIYGAMFGAAGFVLLIACANLANLMLARAIGRSREMSLRIALGAGRWRIVRQLLIESMLLSSIGGIVGWWIAKGGVGLYELLASPSGQVGGSYFDNMLDYTMDDRVLVYFLAISVATGLLFGVAPARRLSRLDVNATMKDGGHGAAGGVRGKRLSALVVIGEMALAVVLIAGAGVMIRSFLKLYTADVGVKTAGVLTLYLNLPESSYPGAETKVSFYDRLTSRLHAIPGVQDVSIANVIPAGGSRRLPYEVAGAQPVDRQRRPTASTVTISPAYFRTLGATVLSGRDFNDLDGVSGVPAVVVNERFAREHWPGEDALGKRLRLFNGDTPDAWLTIVGVTSNIVQDDGTRQAFDPVIYLPYRGRPAASMWLFARTQVAPESVAAVVRSEIAAIDADLPIWLGPFTLDERLQWGYAFNGSMAVLFLLFAATSLLLASVGLYAVIAHAVSQRTQEIGIRTAMGATGRDVLQLVLREGMLSVGIGLTVGLAATLAVTPILRSQLVQVSSADPVSLLVAVATLVLSAALACVIPARRAMRVDPIVTLRRT